MRVFWFVVVLAALQAEPLQWNELPASTRALIAQAGITESAFPLWLSKHNKASESRLAEGAAEHIAYFLLQSAALTDEPPLDPGKEARRYLDSLPASQRAAFLAGSEPATAIGEPVRQRMDAFWKLSPSSERHRVLAGMAKGLGWPPEKVMLTAFRFLMRRSSEDDADALYQSRGLSADPYPPSMHSVERGLQWLRANRPGRAESVLLAGPGAELGSRFGVDDSKPILSSQPSALVALLARRPANFRCIDIRPEVVASLQNGPCQASRLDLAAEQIPGGPYDLAVATNVLVYLDDIELALALANFAKALRSGGCLLHNDSRFAARLFGDAAGIPAVHFETVRLGTRGAREQFDRSVVHCKPEKLP